MNKEATLNAIETIENQSSVEDLHSQLTDLSPKIVTMFNPSNRKEEEERFLSGEVRNPQFYYEKLNSADFDEAAEKIQEIGNKILNHPSLPPSHRGIYEEFIVDYSKKTTLLNYAQQYNNAKSEGEKKAVAEKYRHLNIESYGEPDEDTYRSLLGGKLNAIHSKKLTGKADELRKELFGIVNFKPGMDIPERFRPSDETVEWMHSVTESLYGGMLSHIPNEQEEFDPYELQKIFTGIIEEEFNGLNDPKGYAGAAEGWTVSVEKATSVNVKSSEKKNSYSR